MRQVIIVMLGLAVFPRSGAAQSIALPEIVIGGGDRLARPSQSCVDVEIGATRSYRCLNDALQRQVDRVNPPMPNTPPLDARSSDIRTGVVNAPAVQQQYGRNYGKSVIPYRPPLPTYTSPLRR